MKGFLKRESVKQTNVEVLVSFPFLTSPDTGADSVVAETLVTAGGAQTD